MAGRKRVDWGAVREYYDSGRTVQECRDRFGFSNGAWYRVVERGDVTPHPRWSGMRASEKRARVRELHAWGMTFAAIAEELGVTPPTVSYHARRLGIPADKRSARRYDWGEIQAAYDSGLTVRECAQRFGFCLASWHGAVRRGAITPRPRELPLDKLLIKGKRRGRHNLKRRLIEAGLKENRCEECGLSDWRGKPLLLELHHINGDPLDNRLENLQMLCGNCHSQTDNYGGRNGHRRKRYGDEADPEPSLPAAGEA